MLTEDYLMRYIRIATAALAQMIGLKAAGLYQDALFLIDRSLEQLLGLRIDLIRSLETRDLFKLLAEQDRMDPLLLATLGDLFAGEADLLKRLGRPIDGNVCAVHALALYLEASFGGAPIPELKEKIRIQAADLEDEILPEETQFALFSYYRENEDHNHAFKALKDLLDQSGAQADLLNLAKEYYRELLSKPDPSFPVSSVSRAEIQQILNDLKDRQ